MAAGAAEEDRQLVADEFAAAVGEDGWPVDQARPVLLAAAGGGTFDVAALRGNGAADRGAAAPGGVGTQREANLIQRRGGGGEVSQEVASGGAVFGT